MGDFNAYNKSFEDFDKNFNRTNNFIWLFFIMQLIGVLVCIVGIVWGSIWAFKKISHQGLKGTIERVWNGPNAPTNSTNSTNSLDKTK